MDGYCTCGAKLVEDARFCHRCGRPLREEDRQAEDDALRTAAAQPQPPVIVLQTVPVDGQTAVPSEPVMEVHNGLAVRSALISAALVQLLVTGTTAIGLAILFPVIVFAGGWYAVLLYRRRLGSPLSLAVGARVGWIAGVFTFVISVVFLTLTLVMVLNNAELQSAFREAAQAMHMSTQSVEQVSEAMRHPASSLPVLGVALIFQFFLLTLVSSIGGLLNAWQSQRSH